jgi:sugar phosphate isomerase/epimerase
MADPVLGLCSIAALDRPLADVARAAAGAGLDGLEITARPPHLAPDDDASVEQARARAGEHGLAVVAYGAYYGVPDRAQPAHAARDVAVARALGAPRIRVWANPVPGSEERVEPVVESMRAICDRAADAGIDVVVERHLGSWADTAERVEALLAEVDRPNFALNYQVLDVLPEDRVDEQPADAARLAGRARYMHVKNYRPPEEPGGRLRFGAGLEDGVLDYPAILIAAARAGYRGPLAIEFLAGDGRPLDERVDEDARYLRRVWAEAVASTSGV